VREGGCDCFGSVRSFEPDRTLALGRRRNGTYFLRSKRLTGVETAKFGGVRYLASGPGLNEPCLRPYRAARDEQ